MRMAADRVYAYASVSGQDTEVSRPTQVSRLQGVPTSSRPAPHAQRPEAVLHLAGWTAGVQVPDVSYLDAEYFSLSAKKTRSVEDAAVAAVAILNGFTPSARRNGRAGCAAGGRRRLGQLTQLSE